jgi:diguanylate cyclase (GGDEF)-like protein/PAS domain S-box-containing protein
MADTIENQQSAASSEAETLLEFLYLTPVGVVKFRLDGTIDIANPVAAALLMPLAPDSDMSDLYRVLSAVAPDLRDRVEGFQAPAGSICDQLQVAVPNTPTVLTLSMIKINPDTFMAVIQDITRAIEQDTRIRDDQQRFRAIVENVRDYAIYTVDLDGRVDNWNPSLARIGGWEAADVVGAPISIFFPTEAASQAQSVSLLDRARQSGAAEFEGWRLRKDGSRFWGNTVAASLPDRFGRPGGFVLVSRDLTERKHMEDRLVALSITDPMTGAFNRRAAETRLEDVYRGWRRYGRMFSLLMIDCDHFKKINDTWGHDVGDEVLVTLVRICRDSFRETDAIFRWGGEEFLVLLPETGQDFGRVAAERLRLALEAAEIAHQGCAIRITVSIGVAEVCAADGSANDVIHRVDQALYGAKRGGRNRVVVDEGAVP